MRKSPELLDDRLVALGVLDESLEAIAELCRSPQSEAPKRRNALRLGFAILGVLEGEIEEGRFHWMQPAVHLTREGFAGCGEGDRIVRERPGSSAVEVSRKLVEDDHQRQGRPLPSGPFGEFTVLRSIRKRPESFPDQVIETRFRCKPMQAKVGNRLGIFEIVPEPGFQYGIGVRSHGSFDTSRFKNSVCRVVP